MTKRNIYVKAFNDFDDALGCKERFYLLTQYITLAHWLKAHAPDAYEIYFNEEQKKALDVLGEHQ